MPISDDFGTFVSDFLRVAMPKATAVLKQTKAKGPLPVDSQDLRLPAQNQMFSHTVNGYLRRVDRSWPVDFTLYLMMCFVLLSLSPAPTVDVQASMIS